jgi:Pvc16 N-terminal domain
VINLVDRGLERFLRESVPLDESAVDLSFETPDKTWGAGLTRPTVNVYLWDIASDAAYRRAGMQERTSENGAIERRPANPVVALRYIVTAWASQQKDEHQLLGSVLHTVLKNPVVPPGMLPDQLSGTRCGLALASPETRIPGEFWSALDGRFKPSVVVEISVPVEVFAWLPTAKPAESLTLNPRRMASVAGDHPPEAEPTLVRRRLPGGALVMEGKPEQRDADKA